MSLDIPMSLIFCGAAFVVSVALNAWRGHRRLTPRVMFWLVAGVGMIAAGAYMRYGGG